MIEILLWNRIEMSPPLIASALRRLTSVTWPGTKPWMIGAMSKPAFRSSQRTSTDVSFGETAAVLSGTVGWRHAFGDLVPTSTLAFVGRDAFTVGGAPIARDAALVEAGIDFKVAPTETFGVNYTGQIASGVSDHGVNAKLKVSF